MAEDATASTIDLGTNEARRVIVTGAGNGIGRATVERFLAEGARVVAVDRDQHALAWCDGVDGVVALAGDITTEEANAAMVAAAVEHFGGLDAIALNAGIVVQGDIERGSMADYDRVMDVNVRGVVLGLKAALTALGDGGSIVITGSVSGIGGDSGLFAYNASKGAVVNLTRSAALDLGHRNIRVNAVCPGPTRTAMTAGLLDAEIGQSMQARLPLQRFGDPSEVAAAVCFLASPASSFITGVALPVDGGVTCGTGQWSTYGGRKAGYL
ncbi:MAG: SDR family oxidoreductase [Acidimicrobiales bacterium]